MLGSCVAYQEGERLADIEPRDIHKYLAGPQCFVWVALFEPEARLLEAMQAEFDLHPLAVEDARHGHQRPKIEEYSECLFVVLHMIEPQDAELRVGELAIFVGQPIHKYSSAVRCPMQPGTTLAIVRASIEHAPGPTLCIRRLSG